VRLADAVRLADRRDVLGRCLVPVIEDQARAQVGRVIVLCRRPADGLRDLDLNRVVIELRQRQDLIDRHLLRVLAIDVEDVDDEGCELLA
jgi:hypothetical protein